MTSILSRYKNLRPCLHRLNICNIYSPIGNTSSSFVSSANTQLAKPTKSLYTKTNPLQAKILVQVTLHSGTRSSMDAIHTNQYCSRCFHIYTSACVVKQDHIISETHKTPQATPQDRPWTLSKLNPVADPCSCRFLSVPVNSCQFLSGLSVPASSCRFLSVPFGS